MNRPPTPRRNDELKGRYERHIRAGILASVLAHVLIFLIFSGERVPPSPLSAAGPRAGDDAAAPAGGAMQAIELQPQAEEDIIRPPDPVAEPVIDVELEDPSTEFTDITMSDFEGISGEEEGPEEGEGLETGTGEGDGGTAEEGRFRMIPASPRGMILPPSDRPNSVRGKEVEVWVWVTETGSVAADSTLLRPGTGDRKFDQQLRRQAAEWVFRPATRGGQEIAAWFQYVITL